MKIRQLEMLVAICDSNMNISRAAQSIYSAQSAISKQIQLFEQELNVELFVRRGKRLVALTPTGKQVLEIARQILVQSDNIRKIAGEHAGDSVKGELRIGTTHLQARYVLPPIIQSFQRTYGTVRLRIEQNTPDNLIEMLRNNRVDIAICTERLQQSDDLQVLSGYRWNRYAVIRPDHPLARKSVLSLEDLGDYPLITYIHGFTGRQVFEDIFSRAKIDVDIVFSAVDSDVIKTYAALGLGIGVVAQMAYDAKADAHLVAKDLSHLFPIMETKLAYRKDKYLTGSIKHFISVFVEKVQALDYSSKRKAASLPTDTKRAK